MLSLPTTRPFTIRLTYWAIGLIILLGLVFYVTVFRYAVNVPLVDDFLFLFSITRLTDPATSPGQALAILLEQHNDHRILLARLFVLADYLLEGTINYRTLIIISSLSVLGLLWVVGWLLRRAGLPVWALVPVALLLFQPSYYENVWWSLSALQHTVSLLAYLGLFILVLKPDRRAQIGALLLTGLMIYSNSNGIMAWIAACLLLVIQHRWRWVSIWFLTGAILTVLYYTVQYDFRSGKSIQSSLTNPDWLAKSILGFLGGGFFLEGRPWLGPLSGNRVVVLAGLTILGVFAISLWLAGRQYVKNRLFFTQPAAQSALVLLALAAVLTGTALAAGLTRSDGLFLLMDRYGIYSILALITAYALVLIHSGERTRQRLMAFSALLAAWFAFSGWTIYLPRLINFRNARISETYSLSRYGRSPASNLFLLDPYWQGLLKKGMSQGIYRLPDSPLAAAFPVVDKGAGEPTDTQFTFTNGFDGTAQEPAVYLHHPTLSPPDYLLLRSAAETHVLPAGRLPERSYRRLLRTGNWLTEGVTSSFFPRTLKPGDYRIGYLHLTESGPRIAWTSQVYTRR